MNGGRGIIKKTHFENKIIIKILDGFTSEKNKLLKIRKVLLDGDGPRWRHRTNYFYINSLMVITSQNEFVVYVYKLAWKSI